MIIKAINNNQIGAYILMLLFLSISWVGAFLAPVGIELNHIDTSMPSWRMLQSITSIPILSSVLSLLFAAAIALIMCRLTSTYQLLSRSSVLPAYTFVFCIALFPQARQFTPAWILSLLFIISATLIFESHSYSKPANKCFLAALWLSVACMFQYDAILSIPVFIIIMGVVGVLNIKTILAFVIGLIVPWLLYSGYFFLVGDKWYVFWNDISFLPSKFITNIHFSTHNWIAMGVICLFILLSFISVGKYYNAKKIYVRVLYRILIVAVVSYIFINILTGSYVIENTPIVAVPVSIIIAHFIDNIKSLRWQNIITLLILTIILISQIFV